MAQSHRECVAMLGMKMGVMIYADNSREPEPAVINTEGDTVEQIQTAVGGVFDAVRATAVNADDNSEIVMVGYVNDEGLLLNLPSNAVASMLFGRTIVGDVLLFSGTNPENGEYDGENYEIPFSLYEHIVKVLYPEAAQSVRFSRMLAQAVGYAVKKGIMTMEDFNSIHAEFDERSKDSPTGSLNDFSDRTQTLLAKALDAYLTAMLGSALQDELGDDFDL